MRRPTLIVMVKEPVAGRVKTRLGRDIGMPEATWWFRHQTRRLLRDISDPRWDTLLSVSPDTATGSRQWPANLRRVPQGKGDLGVRMARALKCVRGPVILIGGDIPGVQPWHIAHAFRLLGRSESVVGPAEDGGFWLVGLRHPARAGRALFCGVGWSQRETLRDTLPTLPPPVARAALLFDVDTAVDLNELRTWRKTA